MDDYNNLIEKVSLGRMPFMIINEDIKQKPIVVSLYKSDICISIGKRNTIRLGLPVVQNQKQYK